MDFMIENIVELAFISGAVIFSKQKTEPIMLFAYSLSIQFVSYFTNEIAVGSGCSSAGSLVSIECSDYHLAMSYVIDGLAMVVFSGVFFFVWSRMALIIAMVIVIQVIVQAMAIAGVVYVNVNNEDLMWVFDLHYFLNDKFVIIYVVIAWMCVYYSRMDCYGRQR